jgi:hypothetical protein
MGPLIEAGRKQDLAHASTDETSLARDSTATAADARLPVPDARAVELRKSILAIADCGEQSSAIAVFS